MIYAARTGMVLPEPAELEELASLILARMFESPLPAQRVGRPGQKQYGVDATVRAKDGRLIGAQTKRYLGTHRLTLPRLRKEIAAANTFEPPLDAFIVITTQPADIKLQREANAASIRGRNSVQIWSDVDLIRFLEAYGLGHYLYLHAAERDLLRAYEHKTGRTMPVSVVVLGSGLSPTRSGAAKVVYDLLDAGRPNEALVVLDRNGCDIDRGEGVLLRAKALFSSGDFAACAALPEITTEPTASLLAVAGLAAARAESASRAAQLQARALALADNNERPYVVGLSALTTALIDPTLSYAELLERIPPPLRESPDLAQLLGDLAMSRDEYAEAVRWFERAAHEHSNPARMTVLALATACVAAAIEYLPLGESELSSLEGRQLAERGRIFLDGLRVATPPLDSHDAQLAVLSNLAIALSLLGIPDQSLERARDAVDLDPADQEMWQRWLTLFMRHRRTPDFAVLNATAPDIPDVHLLIGKLALLGGRADDARIALEKVLTAASATASMRERARFALLQLEHPDELPPGVLEECLNALATAPFAAGQFLIAHLADTSLRESASEIATNIASAANKLPLTDQVALAAMLRDRGHAADTVALLPALRHAVRRAGRIDPSVADILCDVLVALRRFTEADALTRDWEMEQPEAMSALVNRSAVLLARGELETAWERIAAAIRNGTAPNSVGLLEQFAYLSRALGRLRVARAVVAAKPLPEAHSARTYRSLLAALTILHDRRIHDVLLLGTQGSLIDESTSGAVFALAIRQRPPPPRIGPNTAVALRDLHSGDERLLWLGARGAGLHEAAPVAYSEAWLAPLRGKTLGEEVKFELGPFAGRMFTINSIRHPQQLLIKHAESVAVVAGLERGGVGTMSEPDVRQMVTRMREELEARRDYTQQQLALTQSLGLPSPAAALVFGVSPREFLQRGPGWTPMSGAGNAESVRSDEAAIDGGERFVLDPATLLLLVTLEATSLASALTIRFVVTPQTVAMLRQWYLMERDSIRAKGVASLGTDGRMAFREYRSYDRRVQWSYWRKVRAFIRESCDIIAVCDDDVASRSVPMEIGFDTGTLSAISLAAERTWCLVAEESGTRDLAAGLGATRTTTLQRLIVMAGERREIPRADAVRWLARLIELGWSFIVLPLWSFGVAARLPPKERRPTLQRLFSILRTADPYQAAPAILGFLTGLDRLRSLRRVTLVDPNWLRRVALRGLPPGTPAYRDALLRYFDAVALGRTHRALRRALRRWTNEQR